MNATKLLIRKRLERVWNNGANAAIKRTTGDRPEVWPPLGDDAHVMRHRDRYLDEIADELIKDARLGIKP